jgi:signal transduction histidine kinase
VLQRFRVSLANKCQLLFGAAVILILTAALGVVWSRMETQLQRGPEKRAQDLAQAWIDGQVSLQQVGPPAEDPSLAERPLDLRLLSLDAAQQAAEDRPLLAEAIDRFHNVGDIDERFARIEDADGEPVYRLIRAVRKRDLERRSGRPEDQLAPLDNNPLEMLLMVDVRDRELQTQRTLNRLAIIAAGLFAGLLAIAVFWFITTRIILQPVRLLRGYAQKVSQGDLNIRSDINTGDEYEQLSDMFNLMLENLKDKQDQLQAAGRSLELKLNELAESNLALYEANKLKGDFLANVSHELRTPLNSIIGFAEVLQETLADRTGPVDDKRKRYTSNIITSSRRLLELINDLLDLAKIEAGRLDLRLSTVSISDTAEGLATLIRPLADKRHIQLAVKVPAKLPAVETDAGKLQQVLFNFLANAVKFTPPGGKVTLAATLIPARGKRKSAHVRVSVSDTGPGIPEADHDRIFDKFTQLDSSVTKEHPGTGLGLTISRELAEVLQGRIELDSEPGKGATFSLVLPIVYEPPTAPLMPDDSAAGVAVPATITT